MRENQTGAMEQFPGLGTLADGTGTAGLVVLYADGFDALPGAWPLSKTHLIIGRDPSVDIQVPVNAVSRRHAEIVETGAGWHVRDLGSRNGTLVDGIHVTEAVLEPLAELRIGDAVLKLVSSNGEDYANYRIDGSMAGKV